MYFNAKRRARVRNIPFNLMKDDIVIPSHCFILGIKLKRKVGRGNCDTSPVLDRIIPDLGYVRDNVQIISAKANNIKSNANLREIELVYLYMKEKENGKFRQGNGDHPQI